MSKTFAAIIIFFSFIGIVHAVELDETYRGKAGFQSMCNHHDNVGCTSAVFPKVAIPNAGGACRGIGSNHALLDATTKLVHSAVSSSAASIGLDPENPIVNFASGVISSRLMEGLGNHYRGELYKLTNRYAASNSRRICALMCVPIPTGKIATGSRFFVENINQRKGTPPVKLMEPCDQNSTNVGPRGHCSAGWSASDMSFDTKIFGGQTHVCGIMKTWNDHEDILVGFAVKYE